LSYYTGACGISEISVHPGVHPTETGGSLEWKNSMAFDFAALINSLLAKLSFSIGLAVTFASGFASLHPWANEHIGEWHIAAVLVFSFHPFGQLGSSLNGYTRKLKKFGAAVSVNERL
jgi:hypothetical protein